MNGYEEKMLPAGIRRKMPGLLLVLSVVLGGLREPWQWPVFGAVLLGWLFVCRVPLSSGGDPLPAALFAWLGIAAIFSPSPLVSLPALAVYLASGLMYFSASGSGDDGDDWLYAVVALGALTAGVLLAQRLSGAEVLGLMGRNPNYSAAFAAAAFAALPAAGPRFGGRALLAGLGLLLAAGLIASASRGALLAGSAGAFFSAAAAGRKRAVLLLAAGALVCAALLPAAAWESLLKTGDAQAFARPRLWAAALHIASGSPLLGAGPGLYPGAFEYSKFPYFDGVAYYGHTTVHAHGQLFQLAAEAGYPAALCFLAFFLILISGAFRRRPALAGCLLAVFMQGCVDVVFYSGSVSLLFWGTAGYLAGAGNILRPRAAWLIPAGLLWAALLAGARQPRPAYAAPDASKTACPEYMASAGLAALDRPKDPFAQRAAGAAAAACGALPAAAGYFEEAIALEPFFAGARADLAVAYSLQGRAAEACAEARQALRSPERPPARLTMYQRGVMGAGAGALAGLRDKLCGRRGAAGKAAR